uniref:Uncharacterized protein n=1 Tax=Parascaris univalens TaxID=6257 RepID=A0A915BQF4_PARUN
MTQQLPQRTSRNALRASSAFYNNWSNREKIDNSQTEFCTEKRLPRWALLEVEKAKEADAAWSIRKLRDKLHAIVRIRENMRTATTGKQGKEENPVGETNTRTRKRASTEPHWGDICPRSTTLKERFDRARQLRLCFKYLRDGHNQRDCTRNVSSYHCKRKGHPAALCKTWHRSQQRKRENAVGETHTQTIRTVSAIATPEQQEQDRTVLLLSTFVELRGDASHTKTIKVPFDTEEIVQHLGIEATHKRPLIVDGFGGTHCTSARVKLKMKRTDGRLFTMFANSVPRLTSEIAIAKLTEKTLRRIRSTQNITLPTVTLKPQILAGADCFHEMFRGSASTKLPPGFHLIRTCLGDMISGQERSNRHGTSSKIKPANRYYCNVASGKD